MAQTKSKTKAKAKPRAKSSAKAKAKSAAPKRAKSKASKPKATKARSQTKSTARSNGSASKSSNVQAVQHIAEGAGDKAKSAGKTVGKAASKAKIPLVAGGAALAGAAGGLALASSKARKSGVGKAIARRPKIKLNSSDVARAAKEVGNFSTQVGELAGELQRNREAANGNGKHRSPVEVVLQGLTSRR